MNIYILQYVIVTRVGDSGRRARFVSTRLTRLHNRVRHEPDPIINRVELQNPNTTHFTFVLPEHDPGNTIHWFSNFRLSAARSGRLGLWVFLLRCRLADAVTIKAQALGLPSSSLLPSSAARSEGLPSKGENWKRPSGWQSRRSGGRAESGPTGVLLC
jgi:hypothetical protein